MKPRIKLYSRNCGPLAWECRTAFECGYGDTPKAAYDNWANKLRGLSSSIADPYRRLSKPLDLLDLR